ncbi:coiled-coil domain-containing protein 121 [Thomomys bottae]
MESPDSEPHPTATRRVRLTMGPKREGARAQEGAEEPQAASASHRPSLVRSKGTCNLRPRVVCDLRANQVLAEAHAALEEKLGESSAPELHTMKLHTLRTYVSACTSLITFSDLCKSPSGIFESPFLTTDSPEGPYPQSPYLTILSKYMNPETLTRLEKRVQRKTVTALKTLSKQKEAAKVKQQPLLQESRQLLGEKLHVRDDSRFFLDYLTEVNQQCKRKHQALWEEYFQNYEMIEQKRQELISKYTKQDADLKTQLMQGRRLHSNLQRQLQTVTNITKVKERQDTKLEALKKEKDKVLTETPLKDQPAHLEFLQRRELLTHKLKQLDTIGHGKNHTGVLKKEARALELKARQVHLEFCQDISATNKQLRKEMQKLTQQYQKLKATETLLETQKQMLKEERWYLEALKKGRQRLQAQRMNKDNVCSKAPVVPQISGSHPLGTKSRINRKGFLQLAMK